MNTFNWHVISKAEFWSIADEYQESTLAHAQDLFSFAETASPDELRSLLIQYRFFTIYYIPDLAILIARLQDGRLRSFLADILSDELGFGDERKAHPRLYDDFLRSIGVDTLNIDDIALSANITLLEQVRRDLLDPSRNTSYGIGLRGMGGECVCQIYLAKLYEHLIRNPFIERTKDIIDWRFWDLHIGEHDIEHREKTRQLIDDEIVKASSGDLVDLGKGFHHSMASWKEFWDNIFSSVSKQTSPSRTRVLHTANFHVPA